jgi:hypothetical protein
MLSSIAGTAPSDGGSSGEPHGARALVARTSRFLNVIGTYGTQLTRVAHNAFPAVVARSGDRWSLQASIVGGWVVRWPLQRRNP